SPTFNDWLGLHWPPFEARFIDDELVVTKVRPGIEGLAPGDVIRTIDLQPVASWVEEFTPYANASNEPTRARNLMRMIIRGQAGPFDMTVFDGQQERTYSLTRDFNYLQELNATEEPIYRVEYQNGCRVGRIDMERLAGNQIEDMFTLFEQTDAIIFDIRNYPNPILWDLVSYLHPTPFDFLKFTTPNLNFAGHFSWREERFDQVSTNPYAGQVFILFDEYTQSLAELTVMSLEPIPGSVKVGSTTAAAFGNISYIVLPGNIRTAATFFGVHYPDYSPTHRVGNV
ncbi:MAG TPA: hypothetical protein DCR93_04625, partial [Cytophagales bacterium]|nr:hypothetical protein [Cytophagales bacterium]